MAFAFAAQINALEAYLTGSGSVEDRRENSWGAGSVPPGIALVKVVAEYNTDRRKVVTRKIENSRMRNETLGGFPRPDQKG